MSHPPCRRTLWELTASQGLPRHQILSGAEGEVALAAFASRPSLDTSFLAGRSVLLLMAGQLPTILALLSLDGVARRIVLAPPDLAPGHLDAVVAQAEVDTIIGDERTLRHGLPVFACNIQRGLGSPAKAMVHDTEWVLLTSGTSGAPKLVSHSVASLTGPVAAARSGADGHTAADAVWSTFYDVRRYGGLTILLRALLGGGAMVLSDAFEPTAAFLARSGRAGVTHISGTPSHWRRVLISGHARCITPRNVRLSGEVADQTVLDRLCAAYPAARITHAFASTEAGLGFEVTDGRAGFPAAWIGAPGPIELRVVDDTLHIRSNRLANGYLSVGPALTEANGFVDTGDIVTLIGERYHFLGRRGGVINVGGQKVYPEVVEAALHAHPAVLAARVRSRPNPITGALVAAEVVVDGEADQAMRVAILAVCRARLALHSVPAVLSFVAGLDVAPSGKLARHPVLGQTSSVFRIRTDQNA